MPLHILIHFCRVDEQHHLTINQTFINFTGMPRRCSLPITTDTDITLYRDPPPDQISVTYNGHCGGRSLKARVNYLPLNQTRYSVRRFSFKSALLPQWCRSHPAKQIP